MKPRFHYDMQLRSLGIAIALALTGISAYRAPAADATRTGIAVRPTDCFLAGERFATGLEQLRLHMGKPTPSAFYLEVQNAEPREVYFQAETTFLKINRLAFDLIREEFPAPAFPAGTITPADVLVVINASQGILDQILTAYEISAPPNTPESREEKIPTDVFNRLTSINRQINIMLDKPFTPSDVFQRVTLCVHYATELRARFPGPRIPETPTFQPQQRPVDVYQVLSQCFETIERIANTSGLSTLNLALTEIPEDDTIAPGDVYDFSSLILAELRFFHALSGAQESPIADYYPGRKFPAHVHQRARLLLSQLNEMEPLVQSSPAWLEGN